MTQVIEKSVFSTGAERYTLDLTQAGTAALPGLRYMHDTDHGQMVDGWLPDDHPYFSGAAYDVENFYFDRAAHEGAWQVRVWNGDTRLMRSAIRISALGEGTYYVGLVQPVKGAVLKWIEDPELAAQTASVLSVFAEGYEQFSAQQRLERAQTQLVHSRRSWGIIGRMAAALSNR